MSEKDKASEICQLTHHNWVEEYYGYRCSQCQEFIPYGCEPWMPLPEDDENGDDDDSGFGLVEFEEDGCG